MTPEGLLPLVAALVAAGALTGFASGLLGIGGGGILVPVLYEAFTLVGVDPSIRMHMALGTSLAVIVPTSLRSFSAHRGRGGVDVGFLKSIAPFTLAGVIVGSVLASFVSSAFLKAVWVVIGSALALKMALGCDDWRLGDRLPDFFAVAGFAFVTGIASVLMSIAGASFMVSYLTLYNWPILKAVATSSGLGPIVAVPGVAGFIWAGWGQEGLPAFSVGYVSILGAALIIPSSVLMAPIGARLAHGIEKRWLELVFAAFLALVAMRFAFNLLAG